MDFNETVNQLNAISEGALDAERFGIVDGCFDGQSYDEEAVEWYVEKFKQFKADGVIEAINAYIHHATQRADLSDFTKVDILSKGMNIACHDDDPST